MLPQFGLLTLRNHLTKMAACQKPQSHSLGPCIILGGCFCYWFWSVLYHQNLWVTLDRYRKIDSIVIDRHIHDCNYFRWFHCGSRIAWPLRRIANPVVSHLGSSNLPCAKSKKSSNSSAIDSAANLLFLALTTLRSLSGAWR